MQRPASSACASKTFTTIVLVIGALVASSAGQANIQGKWSTLSTPMPINPVHAALLNNGKVLVVAGSGNCPPSQSGCPSGAPYGPSNGSGALLVDPVSGQILSQFSVSWDMFCNGMVVLPDGRPFINGGTLQYDPFHGELTSAVFDPATNTFTNVQSMAHGRWYPTVTTLGDGRVMTFSGLDENGSTNSSVEIYSVSSGWSSPFSASWTPPLYPRMHLLPNGKVFYSGATTGSKIFDPSAHTWTNVATTNYSSTRTYGTSVLLPLTPANNYDPRVIIMGGGNPSTATTETIDLGATTPAWNWGPNMSQPRIEMSATILPNGKVLATGGSLNDEDTTTASLNADLYDPATNTFSSAGANSYARLYHSVSLLLPDGTVWLAGGNPQRGTYQQKMEIYQPSYLFTTDSTGNVIFANRPTISGSPTSVSYGNSFTVQTPDAANIASVALIRNGAATHAFDMDQRFVGLSFTAGSGALTVTAPPNGNIAPPGYYMLFLVDSSGVPSVAKFVQLGAQAQTQPDFSVAATPSSQSVVQGNSTSYTINVAASNGFTGTVGLSVSGLPQGATASLNPTSITTSGSSTLTVSTSGTTPVGSYPLAITGTSGSLVHTATTTLVVNAPADFSVSAAPASQSVTQGNNTSYTVNIAASNGFAGTVGLSITGLPQGAAGSFNPSSITTSGSSTLTVSTSSTTSAGSYPLTISATSGALVHTATVTLVVNGTGSFTLSVTPTSQTVSRGSSTQYTVTISGQGGFSGTVNLSVSGLPQRTSSSFNPASVVGSGSSTLKVTANKPAKIGTYPLTIKGTSGSLVQSANVTLIIN
jgi:uncharacterized membrane protein